MKTLFTFCLGLLLVLLPIPVHAEDVPVLSNEDKEIAPTQEVAIPKTMTQEEIDDLFGPEPYLGPTSWLGSKEGRSK